MADFQRRPRSGLSVEQIVKLMYSFFDGLILRAFIDPELNDPAISENHRARLLDEFIELASAALFDFAWSYTEPGSLVDPRRPDPTSGDVNTQIFDALVASAAELYRVPKVVVVEPEDAALSAGIPVEAAILLFPTRAELADSVLRFLVATAGVDFGQSGVIHPGAMITAALKKLNNAAISHRGVIAVARREDPSTPSGTTPVLVELRQAIAGSLLSPKIHTSADPDKVAKGLVEEALRGDEGWPSVERLLDLLQPRLSIDDVEPA